MQEAYLAHRHYGWILQRLNEANRELLRREAAHEGYHSIAELPTPESRQNSEQYTLPGGENYREMLLTLPQKGEGPKRKRATAQQLAELAGDDWATLGPNGRAALSGPSEATRQLLE